MTGKTAIDDKSMGYRRGRELLNPQQKQKEGSTLVARRNMDYNITSYCCVLMQHMHE